MFPALLTAARGALCTRLVRPQVIGTAHQTVVRSRRSLNVIAMASNGAAPGGDPKLAKLRELMAKADGGKGVAAYIVPTEDPHMSEYAPKHFNRREYLSR